MEIVETNKKIRFSGVELLKVIAIFLICISHITKTTRQFISIDGSFGFQGIVARAFSNAGYIGNTIFVICSIWFLLDSNRIKGEKVIQILFDSVCISICFLIGYLISGYSFNFQTIIHQVLPDFFGNVWFVPFYVLFYIAHPFLNAGLEKLSRKSHLCFCICLFFIFGFLSLFIRFSLINSVISSFIIYIIMAYFKKYKIELCNKTWLNFVVFIVGFILFISLMLIKERVEFLKDNLFLFYEISIFLFSCLFGLFNLFRKMNFKSKVVNYISSCSLFFYCFHENILFRDTTRIDLVRACFNHFGTNNLLLVIIGFTICFFCVVFIASIIYKETFHRLVVYLSMKLSTIFNRLLSKIISKNT